MIEEKNTEEKKKIKCVIYTRKSSDEGLEQEFNSLDAQIESGKSYIKSQKSEGWDLLPNQYNDGGISGGTMNRPGLQQLLDDVKEDKIDVVVVYKVDRLSRSLTDFNKIIELFEKHNVSFVSVTQQFNTTSSMGRLTLNILLSFAQFEREVTGERIRDKIALSKKKGMWMGGHIPIGYNISDKKLVPNPEESQLIQYIFNRFIELQSVTDLCIELNNAGFRTKARFDKDGKKIGGVPFTKTALYKILENKIYLGKIRHKKIWYQGEHDCIIDQEIWDAVRNIISGKTVKKNKHKKTPSILMGLLIGPDGKAMTPTHTHKGNKEYRYYITHTANKLTAKDCPVGMIRASDIEGIIFDQLKFVFNNQTFISSTWRIINSKDKSITENYTRIKLQDIAGMLDNLYHENQRIIINAIIDKVIINPHSILIDINTISMADLILDIKLANNQKEND